jgi:hypothetical protein
VRRKPGVVWQLQPLLLLDLWEQECGGRGWLLGELGKEEQKRGKVSKFGLIGLFWPSIECLKVNRNVQR